MRIVRAVKTCEACPSQWDAWTDQGQYLYLRFRHGRGSVEAQPGPDTDTWAETYEPLATFEHRERDGVIGLAEFAELAGLDLAPELVEEHKPGPTYVIEFPGPSGVRIQELAARIRAFQEGRLWR